MALSVLSCAGPSGGSPKAAKEAWTGYTIECGPCAVANGRIRARYSVFPLASSCCGRCMARSYAVDGLVVAVNSPSFTVAHRPIPSSCRR